MSAIPTRNNKPKEMQINYVKGVKAKIKESKLRRGGNRQ